MGLYEDRIEVEVKGREMWERKEALQRACEAVAECVKGLEEEFCGTTDWEVRITVEDRMVLLLHVRMAQKLVREAKRAEVCAVEAYRDMMKHASYAFMALGKIPGHGESVTSRDGAYSVSREQLDIRGLDVRGVINACDGPLKQAGKLCQRLQDIENVWEVRKQIKRHGLKGLRNKPLSGVLGARVRKNRSASF